MKILFICTGNTCRSAMAEGLMKKKYPDEEVSSCGLYAFAGDSASPESVEAMKEYGIDLTSHRARRFSKYMTDEYDIFAVMTVGHYAALSGLIPKERLIILGGGIPDPYGKGKEDYIKCAAKIERAIDELMKKIPKTEIAPMCREDIKDLAGIERECFSSPWSEEGLQSELTNESACFFTAKRNGTTAGYIGMHTVLDECYIANIAVSPRFRRLGIGDLLLNTAERAARQKKCSFISLEVRVSNTPAISLYKKHGFIPVGERKDFYSSPKENALIMTKNLSEE